MKFLTIICSLALLTLVACEKDKEVPQEERVLNTGLNGWWIQTSVGYSIGGPVINEQVDPLKARNIYFGETLFASNDSTLQYHNFSKDSLTFTLYNTTTGERFKYSYLIVNDTLTLSPLTVMCVEGCYTRYKRAAADDCLGIVMK
ncbi:hypothetical protein [uncultured Chitinophaga sp.]|uniref:hypothetical protein n=1 Tax=uncultured Chitinophaga sp. TaxID=339340 RepID=UPI0025DEE964|nr:hypothetical protein [uncultured Chitinophaga sp.]